MPYIYAVDTPYDSLAHHGIKGQKWGVRRYQNPDGSLTDEGYRRYSRTGLMSEHTKDTAKKGAKLGATLGLASGAIAGVAAAGTMLGAGAPMALAAAAGASYLASLTTSGALNGAKYGLIVGAVQTSKGRKYIEDLAYSNRPGNKKAREFLLRN